MSKCKKFCKNIFLPQREQVEIEYGKKNPKWGEIGKRKRKTVDQFDLYGNFIKTWEGMREAARHLGVTHSAISAICRNKKHSINGYTFKYSKQKI